MRWPQVVFGFVFLLVGSYLDNSRGPLMTVLTRELGLTYAEGSRFLVAGFLAAIVFTWGTLIWGARISERRLAGGIAVVGLFTTVYAFFVGGRWSFWFLGLMLGLVVVGLGSLANLIVLQGTPDDRKPRIVSLLHAMYGLGSFLAPSLIGWTIRHGVDWAWSLGLLAPVFLFALASVGRAVPAQLSPVPAGPRRSLSAAQRRAVVVTCLYVAGEVVASSWMVTYLVEYRGLTVPQATPYATGFFLVLGLSRLALFFVARAEWEEGLLAGSVFFSAVGLGLGLWGWLPGFVIAGVLGPFFPLNLARLGQRYPAQIRDVTLSLMGAMQVTLAVLHVTVGWLADRIGIQWAYCLPVALLLSAFVMLVAPSRNR